MKTPLLICLAICVLLSPVGRLAAAEAERSAFWTNRNSFPIAVWLQSPHNAERYKAAGINLYVGLWRGPTAEQLNLLEAAGMRVICSQNSIALSNRHHPIIVGWMHGDEPDNAQSLGPGKGYGPPIKPEIIQTNYARMRRADPTRPVFLNLGQGVAWDNYIGRGVRRNHPEDYPEYIQGCDIASFDIYPVVHDHPEIAGKLEYVARGVSRLVEWSAGKKRVWNCIETTHISNPPAKATPEQIRAEVWMSIIHGSRGIVYFVHQFEPAFKEAALLDDPVNLKAVTEINRRIHELAPVINGPETMHRIEVTTTDGVPVAQMVREHEGAVYLFAVSMRNKACEATFKSSVFSSTAMADVLDEGRSIKMNGPQFSDRFEPYGVHLYRIATRKRVD